MSSVGKVFPVARAWIGLNHRELIVGIAGGAVYGQIKLLQPLIGALGLDLGVSPLVTGIAVCIALAAGAIGTNVFVPMAQRFGHRRVVAVLMLATVGLMMAAPPLITGASSLWTAWLVLGFLTRIMPIANEWVGRLAPGPRRTSGYSALAVGFQAGLGSTGILAALLVDGARWEIALLGNAVLVAACVPLVLLMAPRNLTPPDPAPAHAQDPTRHPEPTDGKPVVRRVRGRDIRRLASPAVRVAFLNQATLWAFDIYILLVVLDSGHGAGALVPILAPVVLAGVASFLSARLRGRRELTHLVTVGPMAVVWPLTGLGLLAPSWAALWTFTAAAYLAEGSSAVYSARGPEEVLSEQDPRHAHRIFETAGRLAGQLTGILAFGIGLWATGSIWGGVAVGCALGLIGAWDGMFRTRVQRDWLRHQITARFRRARRIPATTRGGTAAAPPGRHRAVVPQGVRMTRTRNGLWVLRLVALASIALVVVSWWRPEDAETALKQPPGTASRPPTFSGEALLCDELATDAGVLPAGAQVRMTPDGTVFWQEVDLTTRVAGDPGAAVCQGQARPRVQACLLTFPQPHAGEPGFPVDLRFVWSSQAYVLSPSGNGITLPATTLHCPPASTEGPHPTVGFTCHLRLSLAGQPISDDGAVHVARAGAGDVVVVTEVEIAPNGRVTVKVRSLGGLVVDDSERSATMWTTPAAMAGAGC